MNYSDFLASLFAKGPYDPDKPTLGTFLAATGGLLDTDRANGIKLVNNLSPYTADADGIATWEKTLGLPTDISQNLETRRRLCIARSYRLSGRLTYTKLLQILNSFSLSNSVQVIKSPATYQVYGIFPIDDLNDYQPVIKTAYSYLRAHIEFVIGFKTSIEEKPTILTTSKILVTRNLMVNNSGPVIDGTWTLNGSKILNSQAKSAPTISSLLALTIGRNVEWGHIPVTRGYVLDGGRKVDGTWNISGATTQNNDSIALALAFIFLRTLAQQPIATSAINLTIPRYINEKPGVYFDGGWLLNGQVNLTGIADPPRPAFTISATHKVARFTKTQGYMLEGGLSLDGNWNLGGAITKTDDPILTTITINGVAA